MVPLLRSGIPQITWMTPWIGEIICLQPLRMYLLRRFRDEARADQLMIRYSVKVLRHQEAERLFRLFSLVSDKGVRESMSSYNKHSTSSSNSKPRSAWTTWVSKILAASCMDSSNRRSWSSTFWIMTISSKPIKSGHSILQTTSLTSLASFNGNRLVRDWSTQSARAVISIRPRIGHRFTPWKSNR